MEKLFYNFDRIKKNDNGISQFLKLLFSIGKKSWVHAVITAISGIIIPILWDGEHYIASVVGVLIMSLDILFAYICTEYQGRLYTERKLTYEIFSEESSLIKSLVIEIENNASWKNSVFKKTSELVCEKIYRIFKEVYSCETRVSIEYIFDKPVNQTKKIEQHVKMSGRRSSQRSTVKKAIPIDRKSKYYSYQIFKDNNRGINILSKDKIDDATIWYKNPQNNIDIKQYIGIAVSALDETKVDFIFQIDFLDEFKFGEDNSDKDIQKFIEKYFMSYINIVTLAYLLNLNNKKEIGEL